MFHSDYANLDTTQEFVHVMGFSMTQEEFARFIPKLVQRISAYGREVSMFFVPAKTLEGYNPSTSTYCAVQCHPSILEKVRSVVSFNF